MATEQDTVQREFQEVQERWRRVIDAHRMAPPDAGFSGRLRDLSAACADDQGKFWEMHDRIYAGQDEWSDLLDSTMTNPLAVFRRYAKELGLDVNTWENCVTTQKYTAKIKGNQAEGTRRNVEQTPTIIIGNKQVNAVTYDEFKKLVDEVLADAAKARVDSARKPAGGKKGAAQ